MNYKTLNEAVSSYKEKLFTQWVQQTTRALNVLATAIVALHLYQAVDYYRVQKRSSWLENNLSSLEKELKLYRSSLRHFSKLKDLYPYFIPSYPSKALQGVSEVIPSRTYLSSFSFTPHSSVTLKGFSPSKKELQSFAKALTGQTAFPCKARITSCLKSIGLLFSIKLIPQQREQENHVQESFSYKPNSWQPKTALVLKNLTSLIAKKAFYYSACNRTIM